MLKKYFTRLLKTILFICLFPLSVCLDLVVFLFTIASYDEFKLTGILIDFIED